MYLLIDIVGGLVLSYGDVCCGLCLGCSCNEGSLFFPLITFVLPFALPYVGLFLTSTGIELLLLLRLGSALQEIRLAMTLNSTHCVIYPKCNRMIVTDVPCLLNLDICS